MIKEVSKWNGSDLEHILVEGDRLHKSLNTFDMLSADNLPTAARSYESEFQVTYLELDLKQD